MIPSNDYMGLSMSPDPLTVSLRLTLSWSGTPSGATYRKLEPLKINALLMYGMSPKFVRKRSWSHDMVEHTINNTILCIVNQSLNHTVEATPCVVNFGNIPYMGRA